MSVWKQQRSWKEQSWLRVRPGTHSSCDSEVCACAGVPAAREAAVGAAGGQARAGSERRRSPTGALPHRALLPGNRSSGGPPPLCLPNMLLSGGSNVIMVGPCYDAAFLLIADCAKEDRSAVCLKYGACTRSRCACLGHSWLVIVSKGNE